MSADVTRPPRGGQDPSAPRHLRLVSPAAPKEPRKKRRRPPPIFSPDESARIRAALRHARVLFGGWECAADALYLRKNHVVSVATGNKVVTGDLAVRLSRALGIPLDTITRPGLRVVPFPSICPTCGRGPT